MGSSVIFVFQAIIEDEVTQRFSAEGKICITYLLMSYFIVNKAQYFFLFCHDFLKLSRSKESFRDMLIQLSFQNWDRGIC